MVLSFQTCFQAFPEWLTLLDLGLFIFLRKSLATYTYHMILKKAERSWQNHELGMIIKALQMTRMELQRMRLKIALTWVIGMRTSLHGDTHMKEVRR